MDEKSNEHDQSVNLKINDGKSQVHVGNGRGNIRTVLYLLIWAN